MLFYPKMKIILLDILLFHLQSITSYDTQYILISNKKTWQNANNYCLSQFGSTLATITTDKDLKNAQILQYQYDSPSLLIGLTDIFNESQWEWIDGTSCNHHTSTTSCIDDSYWYTDPLNGNNTENFAILRSDGLYEDTSGDNKYMFLCNNPTFNASNINTTILTGLACYV